MVSPTGSSILEKISGPRCSIEQGHLLGSYDKDIDGNAFMNFLGIPYAKAPLRELRFRPPQPPEGWEGIRKATKEGPPCYAAQVVIAGLPPFRMPILVKKGSEDCLRLNVFTRKLSDGSRNLKPVMVWIHGGAFFTGCSHRNFYGPHHLMIEDVVLVTFNYRLGVLGFLAMDDPSLDATGNAGLKDQVMALKWVQKNIKHFGGDPSNVTIFGQSAGSVSVNLLIVSPLAKGLFHKAIMQSGVAFCPWARGVNDFVQLARKLGSKTDDHSQILASLQHVSVCKLICAQNRTMLMKISGDKPCFWGPQVEAKHQNSLLTKEPFKSMSSGDYNHVPIMMGYTSMEGMFDSWGCIRLYMKLKNFAPPYFGLEETQPESLELHRRIIEFYYKGRRPSIFKKVLIAKVS